jgi:hypothetical protein
VSEIDKCSFLLDIAEARGINNLASFLSMVEDLTNRAERCGYISIDDKWICRKCGSYHCLVRQDKLGKY